MHYTIPSSRSGMPMSRIILSLALLGWMTGVTIAQPGENPEYTQHICVSQAYDELPRTPASFSIRYEEGSGTLTDIQKKYIEYRTAFEKEIEHHNTTSNKDIAYNTTSVFFFTKTPGWNYFGAAVICVNRMREPHNKCRNRTYTVYQPIAPQVVARIVANDIVSREATIRKCPSRWVSGSPRPSDSW